MQNKQISRSLIGYKRKVSLSKKVVSTSPSFLFLLSVLFLFSSLCSPAHAVPGPIETTLEAHLDVHKKALEVSSKMILPAHAAVNFDLSGLTLESIKIDDTDANATGMMEQKLAFEAVPFSRTITLHYSVSCETPMQGCMISDNEAVLTDYWHPVADRDSVFHLSVTTPQNLEVISEADSIAVTPAADGSKKTTFSFPQPSRFLHLLIGPYVVEEETFGNGQIVASYFFKEDQELAASYRTKAKQYLERYSAQIAPYPYGRFTVVENRFPTGYAMPTFTLLGQSVVRLPFIVDTSLGHEVLHSWFGNAVRADGSSGNWCEGLATYLADHAFAVDAGKGEEYRRNQLIKYQSFVHPDNAIALNQFSGSNLSGSNNQEALRAVGYGKSSMIFHMLQQKYGTQIFNDSLRDFYSRMRDKIATWEDLQLSFENTASEDLDLFFKQWLSRSDMPHITMKKLSIDEHGGQLLLSLELHQETKDPYILDVPLRIQTERGSIEKTLHLSEIETSLSLPLADYPLELVVDPEAALARVLDPSEIPPTWQQFRGAQKSLAIVSSPSDFDLFEPLIELLEAEGTTVLAADEVTDAELIDNAILFLGVEGSISRGLFGPPSQEDIEGCIFDIRKNPLNKESVAILAQASSSDEVKKATRKLRHYGKYSFLHFQNGRAVTKQQTPAAHGQRYLLDEPPLAVAAHKAQNLRDIVAQLNDNRVIYVGEAHTRYEDHQMQLRVIRELFLQNPKLAIGMEMFPRSAQESLDRFIEGHIDEKTFLKESDYYKVWSYDYRLYRGILSFARRNKIPVIGLNIEREKVGKVYKDGGISSLSMEEKGSIPVDRDLTMPGYSDRLQAVYAMHPGHGGGPQFANFLQAQGIWDETMAQSVVTYLSAHPETTMVVLAGKAHVIKENAIPPRVKRRLGVKQTIIMSSDGTALYPPEVDYLFFPPPAALPKPVLMGIVMKKGTDAEQIVVDGFAHGGPAEKAGIQENDIILALDNEPITSMSDVKIVMLFKKKGDVIKVDIRRPHAIFADETLSFNLTL